MINGFRIYLLPLIACIVLSRCKPQNSANTYVIEGVISEAVTGNKIEGFNLDFEEQVLENGVLNGFFETAASTSTDETGHFIMSFARKSALAYRLNLNKQGWFNLSLDINPESFSPGVPLIVNSEVTPQADLEVNIKNIAPAINSDKIRFRFLHDFENYTNCLTSWTVLQGATVDTTFSCVLPGNRWMPYLYIDQSTDLDIEVYDSVYCVAFVNSSLSITY